jgi:hypothetical protein
MKEQNYKNHPRFVPLFHFVMLTILIAILVLSVINIFYGINLPSVMFLLIAIASLIGFVMIRNFPLAVQDRAIRAEENLRYFVLTGKLLDKALTIQQIIALRFAADDEFLELTERAIKEGLSNKEIKKAILNWRADHHRA